MRRALTTAIILILLSTLVFSASEFECQQHETSNNVVLTCKASKEVNTVVNKAVHNLNDAELLNKELSMMDPDFVNNFQDSKNLQSQVHAYLGDVRKGVSIELSNKTIKKVVEEDISYEEFINKYVRG
jgi:hypothetical protein